MRIVRFLALIAIVIIILFPITIFTLYETIPEHAGSVSHFDTIIVLGTPANPDGTPSPEQRERTLEGVREYRAGVAPRIIMSGGPAHNHYVEADVMAALAGRNGVQDSAILEEGKSQNTVQNAYYSVKIMQSHGWHSAEVVSSPSHLPRASLIFRHFPIEWRMHPAAWPASYEPGFIFKHYFWEAIYSSKLRLFGFPLTRFLPGE